jgi:hypothetical protein
VTFSGTASICQTDGYAQVNGPPPGVDHRSQYPLFGYNGLLFHHGTSDPLAQSMRGVDLLTGTATMTTPGP